MNACPNCIQQRLYAPFLGSKLPTVLGLAPHFFKGCEQARLFAFEKTSHSRGRYRKLEATLDLLKSICYTDVYPERNGYSR